MAVHDSGVCRLGRTPEVRAERTDAKDGRFSGEQGGRTRRHSPAISESRARRAQLQKATRRAATVPKEVGQVNGKEGSAAWSLRVSDTGCSHHSYPERFCPEEIASGVSPSSRAVRVTRSSTPCQWSARMTVSRRVCAKHGSSANFRVGDIFDRSASRSIRIRRPALCAVAWSSHDLLRGKVEKR